MLKNTYALAWIFWVAWFLGWELTALFTRHPDLTLSDYVWRLEEISQGWTFLRYFVAVFCLWLFFHMAFGLFR